MTTSFFLLWIAAGPLFMPAHFPTLEACQAAGRQHAEAVGYHVKNGWKCIKIEGAAPLRDS